MSLSELYPPTPQNVPASITQPSAEFKKEVTKVMGSIILFFLVYLLMVIAAVALAVACVVGGVLLIINFPRIITLLIGIGIMGLGVMVLYFLVKFIFAVNKYDRSGSIEISKNDEPQLFEFIRRLTKETHTPFPKKIYLTPDVNASVSYDSSFWSMIFPVRKNLQIGLGLVNSLNISEFKAVLAHEFGHFSQKSMKLGSFVYNVNRVIYNMLFENKGYSGSLQRFASASNYFAFFANITVEIVKGIQAVLKGMYGLINKNYMSLSRQMEFHADAVAASVSGGNNLVTALKRIELASTSYNIALNKCDDLLKYKMVSENIYSNQQVVQKHIAEEFKFSFVNGLPVINDEFLKSRKINRVNFKNQWASHPTNEERENNLQNSGAFVEPSPELAWDIFSKREKWQEELTMKIYEKIEDAGNLQKANNLVFEKRYKEDVELFSLPEEYKEFYDNRQITIIEKEKINEISNSPVTDDDFNDILSPGVLAIPAKISASVSDIEVLKAIKEKRIDTKTFDFDGKKVPATEAGTICEQLEKELQENKTKLDEYDLRIIHFFLQKQQTGNTRLKDQYIAYFEHRKMADEYLKLLTMMMDHLSPVFNGQTITLSAINGMMRNLKEDHEKKCKDFLRSWNALHVFDETPFKTTVVNFLGSEYRYFDGSRFIGNELVELNKIANESWQLVHKYIFSEFKKILTDQLRLVNKKEFQE